MADPRRARDLALLDAIDAFKREPLANNDMFAPAPYPKPPSDGFSGTTFLPR
jgi:hypothetical protein